MLGQGGRQEAPGEEQKAPAIQSEEISAKGVEESQAQQRLEHKQGVLPTRWLEKDESGPGPPDLKIHRGFAIPSGKAASGQIMPDCFWPDYASGRIIAYTSNCSNLAPPSTECIISSNLVSSATERARGYLMPAGEKDQFSGREP